MDRKSAVLRFPGNIQLRFESEFGPVINQAVKKFPGRTVADITDTAMRLYLEAYPAEYLFEALSKKSDFDEAYEPKTVKKHREKRHRQWAGEYVDEEDEEEPAIEKRLREGKDLHLQDAAALSTDPQKRNRQWTEQVEEDDDEDEPKIEKRWRAQSMGGRMKRSRQSKSKQSRRSKSKQSRRSKSKRSRRSKSKLSRRSKSKLSRRIVFN